MTKTVLAILLCVGLCFPLAACGGGQSTSTTQPPANAVTSVSVAPTTVTLSAGETRQFSASISGIGTYSQGVTWSVNNIAGGNATVGTVSSSGLYTAPNPAPPSATVTATSTFDTAKSGSATVTITTPATVTSVVVTPSTATISAGSTKQFAAILTGTGTYTSTVTWSVNNLAGGNATVGTISTAGLYTAPNPAPASVTIKATSTFDTTKSGSATVTITTPPVSGVTSVTVAPGTVTLSPGNTKQFSATVTGNGTYTTGVTWSVNSVTGGNATVGTINTSGLYITPYPVPSTVTIIATSTFDTTKSGSATVSFAAPAVVAGPILSVDAAAVTRPINPLIYGMNFYSQDPTVAKSVRLAADRWGGNATTRYNYKLDISNAGNDWFFEVNPNSNVSFPDVSDFNNQVIADRASGAKTIGTVPVIGWTAKSRHREACSFSVAKYGSQQKTDQQWAPRLRQWIEA